MTETWVLLYHALDTAESPFSGHPADSSVVVGAEDFAQQLQCLREMELSIKSLGDVLLGEKADRPQVVLTFDDGHVSNWSLALPRLLDAGAVATFYVIAGKIGNDPGYLSVNQLRELDSLGMIIGSHTMSHPFLPQLPADEITRELRDSRALLEDLLGHEVVDLALPGGHGNATTSAIAQECGYRSVATCQIGVFGRGDNPMRLPRLEIRRGLSLDDFRATFSRRMIRKLQLWEYGKNCCRRVLGLSTYSRLRNLAHRVARIRR